MFNILYFDTLESTNKYAKDYIKNHNTNKTIEPTIILTHKQTGGVGKLNSQWEDLEGNLSVSFVIPILDPDVLQTIGIYSLLSAVCVLKSFLYYLPDKYKDKIKNKWPNDILIDGKKVSGILIEKEDNYLIIGIGANLYKAPSLTKYETISLFDIINKKIEINDFLNVLKKILEEELINLNEDKIIKQWQDFAYLLHQDIEIRLSSTRVINGIFVGITSSGFMQIKTNHGIEVISAGEVFLPSKNMEKV